jgi:hypothetical protein
MLANIVLLSRILLTIKELAHTKTAQKHVARLRYLKHLLVAHTSNPLKPADVAQVEDPSSIFL